MPAPPFASIRDAARTARSENPAGRPAGDPATAAPEASATGSAPEIAEPLFTPTHLRRAGDPLFRFDPGWLFLIAGMVAIALTVLIPAQHDLDIALWQRERAATIERHRQERIDHYAAYLKALDKGDDAVVMSLAASQLNMSPVGVVPLPGTVTQDPTGVSASIFPHLEPAPPTLPGKPIITARSSMLSRWTTSDHARLWMLAGGVLCVLIGLLPGARPATRMATPALQ
jgi:hypothetical protein